MLKAFLTFDPLSCHIHNSSLGLTFIHIQDLVNSRLLFATTLDCVTMSSHCWYFCALLNHVPASITAHLHPKEQPKWSSQNVSRINPLACSKLCSYSRVQTIKPKVLKHDLGHYFSVQSCHSIGSNSLWPHEPQQTRPLCISPTPGVHTNPCPSSGQWCHPTISSSVVPFSSCPQSFPASGSSQVSQLFTSGSRSIGVSASTSVLPINTQDWSPFGWTGWISLQSKGLSRVFSITTVQKHQLLGTQPFL